MKHKKYLFLFALFTLFVLVACSPTGGSEPTTEPIVEPTSETEVEQPEGELPAEESEEMEELTAADCPEAAAGTHQLIDAVQGICFLYPDNYDVIRTDDGSLTLYVKSLLNTEAPLATVHVEGVNGRTIQEIIPDYPTDAELATMSFLTVDLGGEMATVLDMLPGQDANRRIIALHNDRLVDIMIARIGEEYGEVGQQAEALYQMMTESFQFIAIDPEADLVAGPECPAASEGLVLYTNTEDGFCLLLPEKYMVDDTLSSDTGTETAVFVESLMNASEPKLFITVEPANGRTLEDVTSEKQEEFADFEVMFSFGYMLDGVPANQFEQLPGQDLNRQVMLVHNDRFYTLTFVPDDPSMGDVYTEMETLYEMVMDSFSFLK
ncbi:MAG: hypothetical protein CL608_21955 [Anaerolineaceae bacterium]|nr:hypothetical protein [Anaerolineaceae bacterium]